MAAEKQPKQMGGRAEYAVKFSPGLQSDNYGPRYQSPSITQN